MKKRSGKYYPSSSSSRVAAARAFSAMLPKGFVPPSGSSPCHNTYPNSVTFFCNDDALHLFLVLSGELKESRSQLSVNRESQEVCWGDREEVSVPQQFIKSQEEMQKVRETDFTVHSDGPGEWERLQDSSRKTKKRGGPNHEERSGKYYPFIIVRLRVCGRRGLSGHASQGVVPPSGSSPCHKHVHHIGRNTYITGLIRDVKVKRFQRKKLKMEDRYEDDD
nr:Proteasome subunit alpha type-5 [Ipomoea batatas]